MSRTLILLGVFFLLAGLLGPWLARGPWGRLPGDIVIKKGAFTFYFPLATSLVASVLFSLVLWLFKRP